MYLSSPEVYISFAGAPTRGGRRDGGVAVEHPRNQYSSRPRRGPGWRRPRSLALAAAVLLIPGCLGPGGLDRATLEIEAAARPLLEADPNANWTACYNRLVERHVESLAWLVSRPVLQEPARPDNLSVLMHTSLVRLLAGGPTRPALTAQCFETTSDLLHFDLKVGGRSIGEVCWSEPGLPLRWHDLYPGRFDHFVAARVDAEADRRSVLAWYETVTRGGGGVAAPRRLEPKASALLGVLGRRRADVWSYTPVESVQLAALTPRQPLLEIESFDYNLVRAACVWLGGRDDERIESRLIELVAHPSEVVSYNARFALGFSPDPRIRAVIQRAAGSP